MKNHLWISALVVFLVSISSYAEEKEMDIYSKYEVKVTNLTKGQGWGLPIIVSHDPWLEIYDLGMPASTELRILAEDGNNQPFEKKLKMSKHVYDVVAGTMPLPPGETKTYTIKTNLINQKISVLGMLGTTNDTFAGEKAIQRPLSYSTHYANAYDAGTEKNNEECEFIPGPPCMNPGIRHPSGSEGYVYVSNGIHGIGDLKVEMFDWRNPALKIEIRKIK